MKKNIISRVASAIDFLYTASNATILVRKSIEATIFNKLTASRDPALVAF
jgi:hypothetical protein